MLPITRFKMAASYELIFLIFICIHSTLNQVVGAVEQNVLLPHLTTKGSLVAKLPWENGQKSEIVSVLGSDLFHLKEGEVLTTKDLSNLLHQTLPLVIKHELGTHKWFDTLHVKITNSSSDNKNDQTPSFSSCEYAVRVDYADVISGGTILSIPATHTHGDTIRYVLKPDDVFDIDNKGNIFAKSPAQIFAKEYVLELIAVDSSDRTSMPVHVTITVTSELKFVTHHRVRRQIPQPDEVSVYENQTKVYEFDSVSGSSPFYQIVSSSIPGMFRMVGQSIFTANGRRLDYEQKDQRSITVVVNVTVGNEITESRTIKINVENVNDEAPYFITKPEPYLATVSLAATEGETVFTLMAKDPDGSLSRIEYYLMSGAEGRFRVELNTGKVKVVGSTTFERNKEYFVYVEARDVNSSPPFQRTPQKAVQIRVGERAPQIFEPRYVVDVPEETNVPYLVETIKARRFQNAEIRYSLQNNVGRTPNAFTITSDGDDGGEVKLMQTLDYESQTQPKEYNLRVIVSEESSSLSSTAQLIISVTDINDHDPRFPLSTYIRRDVSEDAQVGIPLLNVTAVDQDAGRNAELTFSVSNPLFAADTVGSTGIIRVNGRLDYDRTRGHRYEFQVIARDNGESPRSGSATVIVLVTNVNDEDPEFSTDLKAEVLENANIDQFVHTVHVTDPDGDSVKVFFKNPSTGGQAVTNGPFQITPETGRVFLRQSLPRGKLHYVLNLTAEDDGMCCGTPGIKRHSEAALIVEVVDINDNRPEFPNCTQYQKNPPSVKENSKLGSSVFQVKAVDADQGDNGKIQYRLLVTNAQNTFRINNTTGEITVIRLIDREATDGARDIGITVQASDHGTPQLIGICSFRVLVEDVNDNNPVFTESVYKATVRLNSKADTSVTRVVANDDDSGRNRKVEYSLIDNPSSLFKINGETGIIRLAVDLTVTTQQMITVMAQDDGTPIRRNSTAVVNVTVQANLVRPPEWQGPVATNTPININETHPLDHTQPIARLQATTEGGGPVDFLFITNNQTAVSEISPFVIFRPPGLHDIMHIYLKSSLDYERTESYQLRIRAAANRANSDIIMTVAVQDQNDEAPVFRGYNPIALTINGILTENRPPPQTVVTLQASDADKSEAFRRLRYSFLNGVNDDVARNFSIDEDTGVITTRTTFDLEAFPQGVIRFTVKVDDRVPSVDPVVPENQPNSATATVEVVIQDENDNEPRFAKRLWQAEVPEDVDIGHPVLTLSALDDDKDSQMEYSIINAGNDFKVEPRSGIVRVANLLDFDDPNRRLYNLTVQVYDGLFTDTAQMFINVSDANDNDPVFSENPYVVLNITEESEDVPKVIIKVVAIDPDTERPNDIEYSLNGPLAEDNTFTIDKKTGDITLLRKLDRDLPDGQEVFEFNVLAVDEPRSQNKRTGVSFVRVKPIDINDNAPKFDKNLIEGSVPEHSTGSGPGTQGKTVFAVNAVDYDAGENARVEYNIVSVDMVDGVPLFSIDRTSGQIYVSTMDSSVLDRETQDTYSLVVQAKDKGTPTPMSSNQTITIRLSDINDQSPVFSQTIYQVTMSENLPKGASIISVTASDQDIGINAQLIYSLETTQDKGYFYIDTRNETNEGILRVFESNKIDYENPQTRSFNVTVSVDDVPSPTHKVLAYIEVIVEDFNDNAPKFEQESIQKTVFENITVGSVLATFKATDADSGINKEFEYYIDHSPNSDPKRQFTIDRNGTVRVNKELDRETKESHDVNILAIDKGTPQQTGTAVLVIEVQDINDNAPGFAKDYVVYFEEEVEEVQRWPELIEAVDPDTDSNGPPFYFTLPCNYACPCQENPTCDSFNMTFQRNADKPNGFAYVFTLFKRFDRETQKEYQMPIVMWDSGEPVMTGTNMLQIVIKDKNDNEHEPGLKEIFVYSYEGFSALENVEIGRVYAKDPDDWDIADKEYTAVGTLPEYFGLDQDTGMVKMSGKPPEGTYSFNVAVYDTVFDKSHISEVRVIVKGIPAEAVYSSGSVRLSGITAQEFLERPHAPSGRYGEYEDSKYDKMKAELAQKLSVPESNVDIFSVREGKGYTDVRFAAHGSPWYKPSKLDGLVITNKAEFEQNVGVKVGMVPIDECVYEICDHGCHNAYIVSDKPLVVYANTTSFVGVNAYYKSECNYCNGTGASSCICKASEFPTECRGDFCFNGGTCFIDDWKEIRCKCEEGFDGPRCQQTKHSFSGNGWALYPALAQCEYGRTSLEFITQQQNGLLFYNGPDDDKGQSDFISLQLLNGAPVLNIDHGTGVLTLTVANQNLADNKWHRIDITSEGKVITLTVDDCRTAVITENERSSSEDRSSCESSGRTPGENMYLNVNSLLQMGGTISDPKFLQPSPPDFNGCIKNFRHLGMLYDLYIGKTGLHKGTRDGCPQEEDSCGSVNAVDGLVCGENGVCEGRLGGGAPVCRCKPGWMGDKCMQETPTKDFLDESFLVWKLLYQPSVNRNKIQLRFRSRDKDGLLFAVMSDSREEFIQLEIRNHILHLAYHLGSSVQQSLSLSQVVASNGQWHTVYMERSGKRVKLYMDSGEGPYYTETKGMTSGFRTLRIAPENVFGGALVSGNVIQNPDVTDYESSCMSDVRLDDRWFPMLTSESSNAAEVIMAKNLIDGCTREDCHNNSCPAERQCVPLWEKFDCKCWPGYVESNNSMCVSACRCDHGGTCIYTTTTKMGYYCDCPLGYTGTHCETELGSLVRSATLSVEGLVAILVCLFLFLVLVLAVFLYIKLRKPKEKIMLDDDPYDDIRENIVHYDEDGAGEEDQNAFDISRIRVPLDGAVSMKTPYEDPQRRTDRPLQSALPPGETPDVGNFIEGRLKDADEDLGAPPHDSVREFAHEGGGSDAGSLSSLNTSTSSGDQDYDYLNDWGPKFAKLADMYGAGQADDD